MKKAGLTESKKKTGPFTRELTEIYTKSTLIAEDIGSITSNINDSCGHLVCIYEGKSIGSGNREKVKCSIVAADVSIGEILYDEFEDGFMRRELDTRLSQLSPSEILIPKNISEQSEKIIHAQYNKQVFIFFFLKEKNLFPNFRIILELKKLMDLMM